MLDARAEARHQRLQPRNPAGQLVQRLARDVFLSAASCALRASEALPLRRQQPRRRPHDGRRPCCPPSRRPIPPPPPPPDDRTPCPTNPPAGPASPPPPPSRRGDLPDIHGLQRPPRGGHGRRARARTGQRGTLGQAQPLAAAAPLGGRAVGPPLPRGRGPAAGPRRVRGGGRRHRGAARQWEAARRGRCAPVAAATASAATVCTRRPRWRAAAHAGHGGRGPRSGRPPPARDPCGRRPPLVGASEEESPPANPPRPPRRSRPGRGLVAERRRGKAPPHWPLTLLPPPQGPPPGRPPSGTLPVSDPPRWWRVLPSRRHARQCPPRRARGHAQRRSHAVRRPSPLIPSRVAGRRPCGGRRRRAVGVVRRRGQ